MKSLNLKKLDSDFPVRGLVVGTKGFIVTRDDMVHSVYGLEETAELRVNDRWQSFGLETLMLYAEQDIVLRDWVHYWGIKQRIQSNYYLLQRSCEEIGATETWPEWGAE
mgnify:CR=1 FL=1